MITTNYLVCYDIKEDGTRYQVASHCKMVGLERIQLSVFYGRLSRSELKTLKIQIREIVSNTNSDVHFIKVCSACEKDHEVIVSINLDDEEDIQENQYQEISQEIDYDGGVLIL